MVVLNFFKNVFNEIRLVEWLTLNKTVRYTLLVLGFIIVFTLAVALTDQGLFNLRSLVLTK
jgi:preprotein translocase SecE subunit